LNIQIGNEDQWMDNPSQIYPVEVQEMTQQVAVNKEPRELGMDAQQTYVGQGEKEDRARVLETTPPQTVTMAEAAGPMSHLTAGQVREGKADVTGLTSSQMAGVVKERGAEAARLIHQMRLFPHQLGVCCKFLQDSTT
jgi:hypothetical protein